MTHAATAPVVILRPLIRRLSDVTPTSVRWLVDGLIPAGMLTLVSGATGIGKSQALAALCADVTQRRPFAGRRTRAGAVLYIQAEDDVEATLQPRLVASGADCDSIHELTHFTDEKSGQRLRFTLPEHAEALAYMVKDTAASLVIIDPIVSFSDFRGTGEPSAHEVRAITDALIDVAKETGVAIVLVMHTRKDVTGSALAAVRGSGAWTESCRSVLTLGVHPSDPSRRILAHAKSNLSPKGKSAEFEIEATPTSSRMVYVGESRLTADELHQAQVPKGRDAMQEACAWLKTALADGPVSCKDVLSNADADGLSAATIKRAKRFLGIQGGGKGKHGAPWELPPRYRTRAEEEERGEYEAGRLAFLQLDQAS